jgi:hypothetical protein
MIELNSFYIPPAGDYLCVIPKPHFFSGNSSLMTGMTLMTADFHFTPFAGVAPFYSIN